MNDPLDELAKQPLETIPPPEAGQQSVSRFLASIPGWIRFVALPILAVALTGALVHVPYYSLGPGPSTDVLGLIKVSGARTFPSEGRLLLTTASVSSGTLNLWDVAWVWIDPNLRAVPREALIQPGRSDEEQDIINARDMEESKLQAEVAAFRALGHEVAVIAGARVLTVIAGSPAQGHIRPRDVIVAVDDTRVRSPEESVARIQKREIGDKVRITVLRGRRRITFGLRTKPSISDRRKPAIGVTVGRAFRLPREIEIGTQRIGGPSGGLVFALAIVDAFTREDLTRGHVVAATGEITLQGGRALVGSVGAIEEKVRAARASGADVFLVPSGEEEIARRVAPAGLRILGVGTLGEALAALRALPPPQT